MGVIALLGLSTSQLEIDFQIELEEKIRKKTCLFFRNILDEIQSSSFLNKELIAVVTRTFSKQFRCTSLHYHEQKQHEEEEAAAIATNVEERVLVFQQEKQLQDVKRKAPDAFQAQAQGEGEVIVKRTRTTKQQLKQAAPSSCEEFSKSPAAGSTNTNTNTITTNNTNTTTIMIRASQKALILEEQKAQNYSQIVCHTFSNMANYRSHELLIGRVIRQITATTNSIQNKANQLTQILNSDYCSPSILFPMFANKVVGLSAAANLFDTTAFASAQVIVHVTSAAPALAMDILLAQFHKSCILTVPKFFVKSESDSALSSSNEEAYLKLLGYHQEEDGKLESQDKYLARLESYMKLYGALVQTEISGVPNLHGLEEGWAWLARLLNCLPANIYTAVALEAFIKMAGYALSRRYKSHFDKILNVISQHFVTALEAQGDSNLNPIIIKLKFYINSNEHLKEPQGWRIEANLLSDMVEPQYCRC